MITDIGIVSGKVLELMEQRKGILIFGEIHTDLKQQRELVLMSLGWLLYENYVQIMEDPLTAAYGSDHKNRIRMITVGMSDLVVDSKAITAASQRKKNVLSHLGAVAGKILVFLEGNKGMLGLHAIERNVNEHLDIILMSLGWLVREGYVQGTIGNSEGFVFHLPVKNKELELASYSHV